MGEQKAKRARVVSETCPSRGKNPTQVRVASTKKEKKKKEAICRAS